MMWTSPSRAARTLAFAACSILTLAAACGGASEQPKVPLSQASGGSSAPDPRTSLSPAARTAIDSGNAAFRAGKYELALTQYEAAAKEAPGSAAPYYGIYMVAEKLGRPTLADSAMTLMRERAGEASKAFGDSGMTKVHAGG